MAAPRIAVEFFHVPNNARPQGVEMDVADEFEQIYLFFANDGLITVLKEVPGASMAKVEGDGVAGKQPPHEEGEFGWPGAE